MSRAADARATAFSSRRTLPTLLLAATGYTLHETWIVNSDGASRVHERLWFWALH